MVRPTGALEAAAAVFEESMRCYPLSRPLAAEIITHGRIFQGKDDPHSFTRVERWTSLEAVLANTKLASCQNVVDQKPPRSSLRAVAAFRARCHDRGCPAGLGQQRATRFGRDDCFRPADQRGEFGWPVEHFAGSSLMVMRYFTGWNELDRAGWSACRDFRFRG